MTPHVTGEPSESATTPPPRSTPALARAKIGTTSNAVGRRRYSYNRSLTDTPLDGPVRRHAPRKRSRIARSRGTAAGRRPPPAPLRRVGRDQKAGDHARQRGVGAGGQSRQPHHDERSPHTGSTPLPGTAHQPQGDEADRATSGEDGSDLVAVEHPDDRHRKSHRPRCGQEEDAQLPGKPRADDRESTEHERRVRSDDRPHPRSPSPPDAPTTRTYTSAGNATPRRPRSPPDGRDCCPQSPCAGSWRTSGTHDEEEHDHQSVVDPVVQIQVQAEQADVDPDARATARHRKRTAASSPRGRAKAVTTMSRTAGIHDSVRSLPAIPREGEG